MLHPFHVCVSREDRSALDKLPESLRLRVLRLLFSEEVELLEKVIQHHATKAKQDRESREAGHPFEAALAACAEEGRVAMVIPPEDPNEPAHVSLVGASVGAIDDFIRDLHSSAALRGVSTVQVMITTPSNARKLIAEHLAERMTAFENGRPHPISRHRG